MKWLMNRLQGYVTVTAQGAYPQRLLNLCAQEGVVFWGLNWAGEHQITLTTRRSHLKTLRTLVARLGYDLTVGQGVGLPFFLGRFRHRYAFLLGLTLSVLSVAVLSNFVLSIQVVGNETVPTGIILSQLDALGLRLGAYAPSLSHVELSQRALMELDDLSFMAINRYGTRMEVIVRERMQSPKPTPTGGLSAIYSDVDGIIEKLSLYSGERRVAVGDIVAKGDILISGEVELEPPEYSEFPSTWMEVPALGEVTARTWRTLEGQIPLTATTKLYTGEETTAYWLTLLGYSVKIFGNSSILGENCDKIINVYPCTLPGGIQLPISLTAERSDGYTRQSVSVHQENAQTLVEESLLRRLNGLLEEGDEVISTQFAARQVGDSLQVTLQAQCREKIGVTKPISPTHTNESQGEPPEE